ncbi:MAG: DUF3467 domain-containing protein [Planctomycetota bacterium]
MTEKDDGFVPGPFEGDIYYANYLRVHKSFGEFILDFGVVTPENPKTPEPLVRIIANPYFFQQVCEAFQAAKRDYEEKYQPIKQPPGKDAGGKGINPAKED